MVEVPDVTELDSDLPADARGPGIVLIEPPGRPPGAPAALPGGIAGYAETPEELDATPAFDPGRAGSRRVLQRYLARRNALRS